MFDIYYKKNDNSKLFSYLSEKTENKVKNIKNFVPIYSRFFSLNEKKPANDIYIVDLGLESPVSTREDIAQFIKRINSEYKPKVIGVDVYCDEEYKDASINSELTHQLSSDNVVRLAKKMLGK